MRELDCSPRNLNLELPLEPDSFAPSARIRAGELPLLEQSCFKDILYDIIGSLFSVLSGGEVAAKPNVQGFRLGMIGQAAIGLTLNDVFPSGFL